MVGPPRNARIWSESDILLGNYQRHESGQFEQFIKDGRDDEAIDLFRRAIPRNLCGLVSTYFPGSGSSTMNRERTRNFMLRMCDVVRDDLPLRHDVDVKTYAEVLKDVVDKRIYSPVDDRELEMNMVLKLPTDLYKLSMDWPKDVAETFFQKVGLRTAYILRRREDVSGDVTPEFLRVHEKVMLCESRFDSRYPRDLVEWARMGAAQEEAAIRLRQCVWARSGDSAEREAARTLDLKDLGLNTLSAGMPMLNWLRVLDLSNNAFTEVPDVLFQVVNRRESSEGIRCRIDLRGNPLKLSLADWDRMFAPGRSTGPIFDVDPGVEPDESRRRKQKETPHAAHGFSEPVGGLARLPDEICKLLGVAPDVSDAALKRRYKQLGLEWHPDKHLGSAEASERMGLINTAYDEATKLRGL